MDKVNANRRGKKPEGKKTFWAILRTLFNDEEVGEAAKAYRPWYVALDARLMEVLDRHHAKLTEPEEVKNWILMGPVKRLERAKLDFETPVDREGTALLRSLEGATTDAETALRGLKGKIGTRRAARVESRRQREADRDKRPWYKKGLI